MLFNEPKLLKLSIRPAPQPRPSRFSALQRAEIAEMLRIGLSASSNSGFSALQRAEIAEINRLALARDAVAGFSALQRAEIAEIAGVPSRQQRR